MSEPHASIPSARYRLTGDDADEPWGYALDATGLLTPDPSMPDDPYARRVVLIMEICARNRIEVLLR